jgi:hypothetical protein
MHTVTKKHGLYRISAALTLGLGLYSATAIAQGSDCTLEGWTQHGKVDVGGPAQGIPRYSGFCAIRTASIGDHLSVNHPQPESRYHARFYYYTGSLTGGIADIYQALNASGVVLIGVKHSVIESTNELKFDVAGGTLEPTAEVLAGRWYAIELDWTTGTGNGALGITVTGAGSSVPLQIAPITDLNNDSHRIRETRMGLIAGSGTGTVNFDAFEVRRDGPPGRLCRGDANGDGAISSADRVLITNEILGGPLAPGQPDASEDGALGPQDRVLVTNMILSSATCDEV